MSNGIPSSNKLQPLRSSCLKEHNPKIEVGSKYMGFVNFDDIHDMNRDNHDLENCPLHPDNDKVLRFFKRPNEYGSCLIAVPFAYSSFKAIIFSNCFGNLLIFMQSNKLRVSKDPKLKMLSGRFFKFLHPVNLKKRVFSNLQ
jgi:hypothetical protein